MASVLAFSACVAVQFGPLWQRLGEEDMQSQKGRILCTDDNRDTRELVFAMLQTSGHDVICVESGAQALDLLRRAKFDLIVLDNWMPDLTGTELTSAIREFDTTTPILFYSAAAYERDKRAALEAGAQAYLTKPEGIDHLLDEVDRLIAQNTKAKPL